MNEKVINLIVTKTGITQENAEKSVLVVFDFLKTKLPAPIAIMTFGCPARSMADGKEARVIVFQNWARSAVR